MANNNNYEINDSFLGRVGQYASSVWNSWGKTKYINTLNITMRVFVFTMLFILAYWSSNSILEYYIDDYKTVKPLTLLISYFITSTIYIYGINYLKAKLSTYYWLPWGSHYYYNYKDKECELYFKLNYNSDYMYLCQFGNYKNNCGLGKHIMIDILSIKKIKNILYTQKLPYKHQYRKNRHRYIGRIDGSDGREAAEYGHYRREIIELGMKIDRDKNILNIEFDIKTSAVDKESIFDAIKDEDTQKCLDTPLLLKFNMYIPEEKLSESFLSLVFEKFYKKNFDILPKLR